nr:MAG: SWI/SNF2 family helicase [Enneapterygius tutuilae iridovirus]
MYQFLPYYPQMDEEKLLHKIANKKEFKQENMPLNAALYPHQEFLKRFMSPHTTYDSLLLFHEMGSGKTKSAISVAENLMGDASSGITKTIVIVRGQGLAQNFLNELLYRATDGKYISDVGNKRLWKDKYEFWTMEVFGKQLQKFTDRDLTIKYNNRLFIIDEAHHLKKKLEGAFVQLHRLLHLLPHRKVLLLTGTPIKDDASEFANCANLILPLDKQLPYGQEFNNLFFNRNRLVNRQILVKNLAGRVSFYKGPGPNVAKVLNGELIGPMEHVPLVPCLMSLFQAKYYKQAFSLDETEGSVYINSRQASLFVYPDGSWGNQGFRKYVTVTKKKTMTGAIRTTYKLLPELEQAIVKDLGKYSIKYKTILDAVTQPSSNKTFIYSEFVHGSGAILLTKILNLFGYSQANGTETTKGKRFILATTQSVNTNITRLIDKFNDEANDNGDIIQIFIGSRIVSEGFSLKNVTQEFILTPHWNFSEIDQIVARCWRINSHKPDIDKLEINLLAIDAPNSIDIYMYKTAESKDYRIKQLERLLKELSVDCFNATPLDYTAGSRECDYTDCTVDCECSQPDQDNRPDIHKDDQASYMLLFPPTNELTKQIIKLFSLKDFVPIESLLARVKCDKFVLLNFISTLLYTNKPISMGDNVVFLRKTGNLLFITPDPTTPIDSLMPLKNVVDQSISSKELVGSLESEWIMDSIKLLFEDATTKHKTILYKLPRQYQHFLLTSCIYAKMYKTATANHNIVNITLDYYKGFYKIGKIVYVWLFHEQFGTVYLNTKKDCIAWETSPRDIYHEMREKIYNSKVGYYGLYNPHLDEFCLRQITSRKETDLRKVTVGRRCDDWDHKSLVDIINTRLALNVDISLYNRVELCGMIRKELFARNLVMYNFDCGNQFKIRGRV